MTDRELLEAAAKVAGLEHVTPRMIEWGLWNPLSDDGDALRLAVKLQIDVEQAVVDFWDASSTDPYAATRRAIVRAAAEMGCMTPPERMPDYIRDELPDEFAAYRLQAWADARVVAERERCAKICEGIGDGCAEWTISVGAVCAAEIRQGKET